MRDEWISFEELEDFLVGMYATHDPEKYDFSCPDNHSKNMCTLAQIFFHYIDKEDKGTISLQQAHAAGMGFEFISEIDVDTNR